MALPAGRCRRLLPGLIWCSASTLLEPQLVVLFGPIGIHSAFTHRLECALHADSADVNVTEHCGDEQYGNDTVDHLGLLHRLDGRPVEREDQHIAAYRDSASAQNDDPIDDLLAAVKAVSRRMVVSEHAATALEPFDVDPLRYIAADPHEK